MDCKFSFARPTLQHMVLPQQPKHSKKCRISAMAPSSARIHYRKLPKNLRYPRRSQLPPEFGVNLFLEKPTIGTVPSHMDSVQEEYERDLSEEEEEEAEEEEEEEEEEENGDVGWERAEIEAISSLFQGRIPQKPGVLNRERPLPLPLPHKLRPLGLPTPKRHIKRASPVVISSRACASHRIYKNPRFLVGLARQIKSLDQDQDLSMILDDCARFLRKGSLSLTIRELGHMGLPERALQTFCWAQKQPHLFPDDRILSSTVEVLARNHDLKVPFNLDKFTSLASRGVIEAMARGLIRGGSLKLAWKLLSVAKSSKRILDSSVYAKLIVELGKIPDKHVLAAELLEELAEREDLSLTQQDCTAIMKVCSKLGKFDVVECLFNWFRQSGGQPSVIMYTTLIHSRYSQKKYREAMSLVWEIEGSNCLLDLPAYRVVIKLFIALNDISRAVRYFSKLKEAGFSPTYDIYRDLIMIYMVSGRLAKCKETGKEAELAGFKLEEKLVAQLLQLERETGLALSNF